MVAKPQPKPFEEDRAPARGSGLLTFDWLLLLAMLGLIGASIAMMATTMTGDVEGSPHFHTIRQATYGVIGLVLMLLLARVDYSRFRELRYGLYAVMLACITAVLLLGATTRGSQRWIELPFFTFQPSELGKALLILALAAFVIERTWRISEVQRTARLLLIGIAPAALVLLQPDLGTAMVYVVITATMLFVSGVKWTHLVALGGVSAAVVALVLVAAPAAGQPVLTDYQADRLTAFVNPSDDPRGEGYQINQSLVAIGSGQKAGRGDEATQSRLDFLPERHTDFIFAAVGERYGFIGAALILSLYALLIWRALRILTLSKNFYGSLIASGIVAMLMFQVFVNVGMNVGLAPITGIPLPLLSYGGTSMLITCMAIGLLQSIYIQARLVQKSREPVF